MKAPLWESLETVPSDMRQSLPEELELFLGSSKKPGEKKVSRRHHGLPHHLPPGRFRKKGEWEPEVEGQSYGVWNTALGPGKMPD